MDNPWVNLPSSSPFVLPHDNSLLNKYSAQLVGPKALHLEKLPLPYVGCPNKARIILLALNPGFGEHDIDEQNNVSGYAEQFHSNLTCQNDTNLFFLQPKFEDTGGYRWWRRHLGEIIRMYGMETVATRLACVQAFPYSSEKYERCLQHVTLPSQEYTFSLVRQAMNDGKPIVFMRSREIWSQYVPELRNYPCIELSNYNNPCLSHAQMSASKFEQIEAALK